MLSKKEIDFILIKIKKKEDRKTKISGDKYRLNEEKKLEKVSSIRGERKKSWRGGI